MPGGSFYNPLIRSIDASPDPYILKHDGKYHYCLVNGPNNEIWVWISPELAGLDTTPDKHMLWKAPQDGPFSKEVWAPELHFIDGYWYIYFTADDGLNDNHRLYVVKSASSDVLSEYGELQKLQWQDEDFWGIDATIFRNEYDGELYLVWSGWPGAVNEVQNLYIAPMDTPMSLKGPRVLLSKPENAWEAWINEGPSVLQHQGRIFVVYSAHESWSSDYCLGLLSAENSSNLLDRSSWQKLPAPILKAHDEAMIYGPGHNSFFKGPGDTDWIAYHAKFKKEPGWGDRKACAQPITWDENGFPHVGNPEAWEVGYNPG